MLKPIFTANKATYILLSLQDAVQIRNARYSLFENRPDPVSRPHSLLFFGKRGSFRGIKRPGREDERSPPSSEEVWSQLSYTSSTLHAFTAWAGTNLPLLLSYILLILQNNEAYMERYNRRRALYSVRLMGCWEKYEMLIQTFTFQNNEVTLWDMPSLLL